MDKAIQAHESRFPRVSMRQLAKEFGVHRTTLSARIRGRKTRRESHQWRQKLIPEEEEVLVNVIITLIEAYAAPTGGRIVELAKEVKNADSDFELGENWAYGFLDRHPELRTMWSTALETERATQEDPVLIGRWFDRFRTFLDEHGIRDENLWNTDEKGIMIGATHKEKVVVRRDTANSDRRKRQGNWRELHTTVECINAIGAKLPVLVIMKGTTAAATTALVQADIHSGRSLCN